VSHFLRHFSHAIKMLHTHTLTDAHRQPDTPQDGRGSGLGGGIAGIPWLPVFQVGHPARCHADKWLCLTYANFFTFPHQPIWPSGAPGKTPRPTPTPTPDKNHPFPWPFCVYFPRKTFQFSPFCRVPISRKISFKYNKMQCRCHKSIPLDCHHDGDAPQN